MTIEESMNTLSTETVKEGNTTKIEEEGILEGAYDISAAESIYEEQTTIRNAILKKIDDAEYNFKLLADLYKLGFKDIKGDMAAGHIMYRVLVGTMFNQKEEYDREFVFDQTDADIAEVFQKISKELGKKINDSGISGKSKREIKDIVAERLAAKGITEVLQ